MRRKTLQRIGHNPRSTYSFDSRSVPEGFLSKFGWNGPNKETVAAMILSAMRKGEANVLLVRDFHDVDSPTSP